jgi:hypothetical protein
VGWETSVAAPTCRVHRWWPGEALRVSRILVVLIGSGLQQPSHHYHRRTGGALGEPHLLLVMCSSGGGMEEGALTLWGVVARGGLAEPSKRCASLLRSAAAGTALPALRLIVACLAVSASPMRSSAVASSTRARPHQHSHTGDGRLLLACMAASPARARPRRCPRAVDGCMLLVWSVAPASLARA